MLLPSEDAAGHLGNTANWDPDRENTNPDGSDNGTQVYSGGCRNGNYWKRISVFVYLPYPYYVEGGRWLRSRNRNADVSKCPQ